MLSTVKTKKQHSIGGIFRLFIWTFQVLLPARQLNCESSSTSSASQLEHYGLESIGLIIKRFNSDRVVQGTTERVWKC